MIFFRRGTNAKVRDIAQINDLLILLTVTKMGKGKYKMSCVTRTFPEKDGTVRPTINKTAFLAL